MSGIESYVNTAVYGNIMFNLFIQLLFNCLFILCCLQCEYDVSCAMLENGQHVSVIADYIFIANCLFLNINSLYKHLHKLFGHTSLCMGHLYKRVTK